MIRHYDERDTDAALINDWVDTGIFQPREIRRHRRITRFSMTKIVMISASLLSLINVSDTAKLHHINAKALINDHSIDSFDVDESNIDIVSMATWYRIRQHSRYNSRETY